VRAPDIAFVHAERLAGVDLRKFIPFAPDLAVEVLSPTDRRSVINRKAAEYVAAGSRLAWVFDPETRTVTVHEPGVAPRLLREQDTLEAGVVIPGFRCEIAVLFAGLPRE
jgi:Uma2 family endonuclease